MLKKKSWKVNKGQYIKNLWIELIQYLGHITEALPSPLLLLQCERLVLEFLALMTEVCPAWQSTSHHAPLSLLSKLDGLENSEPHIPLVKILQWICIVYTGQTLRLVLSTSSPYLLHCLDLFSFIMRLGYSFYHAFELCPPLHPKCLHYVTVLFHYPGSFLRLQVTCSAGSRNNSSAPQLPEYYSFALIRYFSLHN